MIEKLIKDYDKPTDKFVRVKIGKFAGIVGIISNFFLFLVKIVIGVITSSISVIVDSLNNLSDAGSNIITVIGYTMTGKPADKKHPYGHERMEYLSSLFISIVIVFLGFELIVSSVQKFFNSEAAEPFGTVAIIIMGSTCLVKILMALFYRRLGKHINSQTLKASAFDSISDVFVTIAVVVGMILTPVTGPKTDAVIGVGISIYIIIGGVKLVFDSSNTLLGKAPDSEFISKIIKKIKSYDGVLGTHDLVIHSYGENRCFATIHVEVDAEKDVMQSHDMIDNIEFDFLKEMNMNLVIHMDPVHIRDTETNELKEKVEKILSDLSSDYSSPISMHDFRIVKGITHTNVLFDISVSNEMRLSNNELCETIDEEIKKIDSTYNIIITIDRDYSTTRYER